MLTTPQDLLNLMNESYNDASEVFAATVVRYARSEVGQAAVDKARERMNVTHIPTNSVPVAPSKGSSK